MTSDNWQPAAALQVMQKRARLLQSIRAFFDARNVLEVTTPVLSSAAVTDLHIDSFSTRMQQRDYFLNTSPEYAMKRLLAAGFPSIYQIGPVFRFEEQGPYHNPEFTMLEWYRVGYDYLQLMTEIEAMLENLAAVFETSFKLKKLSYQQAFINAVQIDPLNTSVEELRQCCLSYQIDVPQGMSDNNVDEWLDWILTQAVAPAFSKKAFTLLYDYPASQCALATINQEKNIAERFELYFGELELANGFNELLDATEQRQRFVSDNKKRQQLNRPAMPIDERFLAALESGMPVCAGVAFGLDRLLMVLTGKNCISEVLAFPFDRG